jgi:hypothetical protein
MRLNRLAEGRGLFASPINVLIYQYGEVVLLEVLCLAEGALARQTRRAAGQAHPEVPASTSCQSRRSAQRHRTEICR